MSTVNSLGLIADLGVEATAPCRIGDLLAVVSSSIAGVNDGGRFNLPETGHQTAQHVLHVRTRDFERPDVTATLPELHSPIFAAPDVYRPQEDSRLLIDTLERTTVVVGRRVVDLCTGSGIIAIAAAELGADAVTAWDISEDAVRCAQRNARTAGVDVEVKLGMFSNALAEGPYDVVVSNPPYVPTSSTIDLTIPQSADPTWSWDGGEDGRLIIDPLCAMAPALLADGGTMLLVQSEFSGVEQTVAALRSAGLTVDVAAWQLIPFGPVLHAQAPWLESRGLLPAGRRDEELVVIRADKR